MKNRYIFGSLLVLGIGVQSLFAQDIHFSQYAETPTSINPALAGVTYNTRVIANFKTQWSSVANKYETFGLSFDQTIKHKKLKGNYFAVMFNIFKDVAGDARLSTLNPNAGFTYLQKVSKTMKLSAGVQSGFFYRQIDMSRLTWDEQFDENKYVYDPNLPSGEPETPRSSIISFDMGAGLNLNYVKSDRFLSAKDAFRFDIGASAYHFGLANNSFIESSDEKLKTKYCAYFNSDISIPNSRNAIMPSFLYMRQAGSQEYIAGALFKFILGDPSTYTSIKKPRTFSLGGYYRFKDAIVPTMLYQHHKIAFGVSYDINVSALTPASRRNGGLEIMLRYNVLPGYGVNLGRSDVRPSY